MVMYIHETGARQVRDRCETSVSKVPKERDRTAHLLKCAAVSLVIWRMVRDIGL